jgi:hypothetical protein
MLGKDNSVHEIDRMSQLSDRCDIDCTHAFGIDAPVLEVQRGLSLLPVLIKKCDSV